MLSLSSLLLLLCGAHSSPLRGREVAGFDQAAFCAETSTGSAARFCASRAFAERGEITSDTVAMVAETEARDAARKACEKAFAVVAVSEPAVATFALGTKERAKSASDNAAQRLCEQMSRR